MMSDHDVDTEFDKGRYYDDEYAAVFVTALDPHCIYASSVAVQLLPAPEQL